jgi:hypothetical protein
MKLVPCAICGGTPFIEKRSLEGPGGHGYRGCHEYSARCTTDRCPYKRITFSDDDIYCDEEEAIKRLAEKWNEEMKYTLKLIEEK